MATVIDVFNYLNKFAPVERKMDFDNVGFLVGRGASKVDRILVALDITNEVIDEAKNVGAQLIVSHHPMFFSLKSVTDMDFTGSKINTLIENNIAAICMHTNLDAADEGVNYALAKSLQLTNIELLFKEGTDSAGKPYCCGRMGTIPPIEMREFLYNVKHALSANGLRYHDSGNMVSRVAVVGGSGGSYLEKAYEMGCDTIVTADIKYDVFLSAKEMKMNIIDGDHFCTENTVTPVLRDILEKEFPEIEVSVSKHHGQTAQFF